jgi:DNA modification methylase
VETIGQATLYLGDALELLPTTPVVDLVVMDPPYNFSTSSTGDKVGNWAEVVNAAVWFSALLRASLDRLPAAGGLLWQFLNWRTLATVQKAALDVGHRIESLLVWDKDWIGPGGAVGLRPSYELVALIATGGARLANRGLPDIWTVPWSSAKPNGHPAEKPLELLRRIIHESPGTSVGDPMMGSGTAGVAALEHGRAFVGIEIEERWFDLACRRIEAAHQQGRMFADKPPAAVQLAFHEDLAELQCDTCGKTVPDRETALLHEGDHPGHKVIFGGA